MIIELYPKKVLKIFLYFITFLLFANIMGVVSQIYFDRDNVYGLVRLFNFNTEKNIPTFYSALALTLASFLLLVIASAHRKSKEPFILWGILSVVFIFLAIDEISSIHETIAVSTRDFFGATGLFFYAWVIPYAIALLLFIIVYFKFLLALPKNIMILFLISGGIFVLGAIGIEMLGGWQDELHGKEGLLFSIFYTCEEFLEMLGIVIFIYTLLQYIVTQLKYLKIIIAET